MDKRKIIYYEDELQDEFSVAQITPRRIDGSWRYEYTSLWKKFTHFFWYRVVATPVAYLYLKIVFHHRVENRSVLRAHKNTGYFIYGNHTQDIGDAFIPTMLNFPKDDYVIVHPNNVSMPYLGKINPSLGARPLPDDLQAFRNFMRALKSKIAQKKAVVVYPEAHIWPFYTGIRPFVDTSFHYPIKYGVPTFCFTNTYQKRRHSEKPRIVTYIDGPFFPDKDLPAKDQQKELRDQVYACMCRRAEKSDVAWIRYVKKGAENG